MIELLANGALLAVIAGFFADTAKRKPPSQNQK
jgi:hypothetical protein